MERTPRIRPMKFRAFTIDDADWLMEAHDPSVAINMMDRWPGYETTRECIDWIERINLCQPLQHFVIEVKGEPGGWIGVEENVDGWMESIGFARPRYQSMGWGLTALWMMAAYTFDVLGREKLYSRHLLHNTVMNRICERLGYTYAGRVERGGIGSGVHVPVDLFIVTPQTLVRP